MPLLMQPFASSRVRMCAYLKQLSEACDNPAANELRHIHARSLDASWVRASDAVNPLHGQHPWTAQVTTYPRDLHLGVICEIAAEVLHGREHC